MKISIIVTIYNLEKYVNDGSIDESHNICLCYANKNKNIKYYEIENSGLSEARNFGLLKSSGEYIMFVDGDDYLHTKYDIYNIMKFVTKKTDVLQYKMLYAYKNKKLKILNDINVSKKEERQLFELISNSQLSVSACDKIVKRTFLIKNSISFEKNLLSEDIDWSLKIYYHKPKLKIINENVYVYRKQREGSITFEKKHKHIDDTKWIIEKWKNLDYKNNLKYKLVVHHYLAYLLTVYMLYINYKNKKDVDFLKKNLHLLEYDLNYKVRLVNKTKKIIGLYLTVKIMKVYDYLKNRGVIRI